MKRPLEEVMKMYDMRKNGMTLNQVGEVFSLTRERVRQILENRGLYTRGLVLDYRKGLAVNNVDKTNKELAAEIGVSPTAVARYRKGLRYKIPENTALWIGTEAEVFVSEKLNSLGIKNTLMKRNHPFDILLENGYRIDVKTATKNRQTSPAQTATMYCFSVRADKKHACDFFVCLTPSRDLFIIPFEEVRGSSLIYITWPKPSRSWSKMHRYHNRFDLLKR